MNSEYTPLAAMYGRQLCNLMESVPPKERFLVAMTTEAFINGMSAMEKLCSAQIQLNNNAERSMAREFIE